MPSVLYGVFGIGADVSMRMLRVCLCKNDMLRGSGQGEKQQSIGNKGRIIFRKIGNQAIYRSTAGRVLHQRPLQHIEELTADQVVGLKDNHINQIVR